MKRLEEELASVEVQRQDVAVRLQRITEAIETGAKVGTLLDRMTALESQRGPLEDQAKEIRGRLDGERERLRSVSESAKASQGAFEDWKKQQGGKHRDESRHRLAVVLRDLLARIVLTSNGSAKCGPSTENRRLEVVFRSATGGASEREPAGEFIVAPDLSTVWDLEGVTVAEVS